MDSSPITYIYALVDPETNYVRYVGKANNPQCRYSGHLNPRCLQEDNHKNRWIKKLLRNGLKPHLKILESVSAFSWQEREVYWIDFYRKNTPKRLTNISNGGDGLGHGFVFSDKVKLRMSEAHKRRWAKMTQEQRNTWKLKLSQKSKPTKAQLKKWADQRRGTKLKNSSSKYIGVSKNTHGNSWKAYISLEGKTISCEHYETEIQAALAVDKAIRFYLGENFPTNFEGGIAASVEEIRDSAKRLGKKTSQYNGVSFKIKDKKYIASITLNKKSVEIGAFYLEKNAALAFDLFCIENNLTTRKLNFKESCGLTLDQIKIQDKNTIPKSKQGISQYRGVTPYKSCWSAHITHEKEVYFLGTYKQEADAAKAYDAAAIYFLKERAVINFQDSKTGLSPEELRLLARQENKKTRQSKYHNVCKEKRTNKWYASVYANGRSTRLGTFDLEEDAARAVDKFVLENKLNRPLNFPNG